MTTDPSNQNEKTVSEVDGRLLEVSPQEIIEALEKGREIFASSGWARTGDYAIDKNGVPCLVESKDAASFCALGATMHCLPLQSYHDETHESKLIRIKRNQASEFLWDACSEMFEENITIFNDRVAQSKQDVLDIYDKAIEMATTGAEA